MFAVGWSYWTILLSWRQSFPAGFLHGHLIQPAPPLIEISNIDSVDDEETVMLFYGILGEIFFPTVNKFATYDQFTYRKRMRPLQIYFPEHSQVMYPFLFPSNEECFAMLSSSIGNHTAHFFCPNCSVPKVSSDWTVRRENYSIAMSAHDFVSFCPLF